MLKEQRRRSMKRTINPLLSILCSEIIVGCLLVSNRILSVQSTESLVFLNLFCIPLFIQLKGASTVKEGMLAIGNLICLLMNTLFYYLIDSIPKILYYNKAETLIYPILNLTWMVPFLSIGFSFITRQKMNRVSK